jgi:hypothetical protein
LAGFADPAIAELDADLDRQLAEPLKAPRDCGPRRASDRRVIRPNLDLDHEGVQDHRLLWGTPRPMRV